VFLMELICIYIYIYNGAHSYIYIYIIELIECCHLVGAILIEIPKMVANAFDTKRKLTSRALKVSTNPSHTSSLRLHTLVASGL
jgi:hypothetical protein